MTFFSRNTVLEPWMISSENVDNIFIHHYEKLPWRLRTLRASYAPVLSQPKKVWRYNSWNVSMGEHLTEYAFLSLLSYKCSVIISAHS